MIIDDDLLAPVRESLAGLHMRTTVETVIQAGRARRRRRRALVTATVTTTAVTAVLIGTSVAGSGRAAPQPAAQPAPVASSTPPVVSAHPVAFTVTTAANGTTTLKIGKDHYLDPEALREAFAQHGIPSLVTVGEFCRSRPEPTLVGNVLMPEDHPDGYTFTINPAAIPPGAKLSVGYFGNAVRFGVIADDAPLLCTNGTQPAVHMPENSVKTR